MKDPFVINDPLAQDGLVDRLFERDEVSHFINEYHAAESLRCHIKGCGQPHKNGYTARLVTGEKVLMGNICGKHFLGDTDFTRLTNQLVNERRHAAMRQYITNPTFSPKATWEGTTTWAAVVEELTEFQSRLERKQPLLLKALREMNANGERSLTQVKRVTNRAFQETGQGKPFEYQRHPVCVVDGVEAFGPFAVRLQFLEAQKELLALDAQMQKTLREAELRAFVNRARQAHATLGRVADILESFAWFTKHDNVNRVNKWLSLHEQSTLLVREASAISRHPLNHLRLEAAEAA